MASIAQLQNSQRDYRPPRTGPLICRHCNQPGHFARECDGVRVPPHSRHVLLLCRKTRAHQTAEPQFGWGHHWLTGSFKQHGRFWADFLLSPFRCGHGWSGGSLWILVLWYLQSLRAFSVSILKLFENFQTPRDRPGLAKVRGKKAWRIPGGITKVVVATCAQQYSSSTVLLEPSDSGLPGGLLVSPALMRVIRGTVYIPILNVGSMDMVLHPQTVVGTLDHVNVVSLPPVITEVPSVVATVSSRCRLCFPLASYLPVFTAIQMICLPICLAAA